MSETQQTEPTSNRRAYVAAIGVIAGVCLLLLAPINYPGRLVGVVFDYGHVPVFAILVYVVTRLLAGTNPSRKAAAAIALAAVVFGIGGEFVQKQVGRSAELGDAFANAVGAAIGFLWATWNGWTRGQKQIACVVLVTGVVAAVWEPTQILIDINRQRTEFPMLGSFETELELSRWRTRKSGRKRSQSHASDGEWSLEWRPRPDKYPGIHTRWPFGDWDAFERLEFDIWNDDEPIDIVVKIEDGQHTGLFEDRFQQDFRLSKGKTTIVVKLDEVRSAPAGRKMNMQSIARVSIFTIDLKQRRVFYVDRLQLAGAR